MNTTIPAILEETVWDETSDPYVAHWKNVVGLNPYAPLLRGAIFMTHPHHHRDPPLFRLRKPLQITFIKKLSAAKVHNRAVWMVSWRGSDATYSIAILKIYLDHDPGYERESAAYASAVPSAMPSFYGAYSFSSEDLTGYNIPLDSDFDTKSCRPIPALLFEYVDGQTPTPWNITPEIAKKALCSLEAVHRAGIVHDDLALRNMIISRDKERFVIIDFDSSRVHPEGMDRLQLYNSYPFVDISKNYQTLSGLTGFIGHWQPADEISGMIRFMSEYSCLAFPEQRI
ncbi:hypothetical protein C8J56DRAFT_1080268 [Mycena floridula]|nr:hypothetical protein C8J56DRAFT_1080268 [Mycena floridula]